MAEKHFCEIQNAQRMWDWIKNRKGLAIWMSADLSRPGRSVTTPVTMADGKKMTKPDWWLEEKPSRIITDPDEVEVQEGREVKRFHVAVRMSSNGMMAKLTDASSRKVRAACEKAGEESWYEFDYSTQECVVFVPATKMTLREWAAKNGVA